MELKSLKNVSIKVKWKIKGNKRSRKVEYIQLWYGIKSNRYSKKRDRQHNFRNMEYLTRFHKEIATKIAKIQKWHKKYKHKLQKIRFTWKNTKIIKWLKNKKKCNIKIKWKNGY